MEYEKQGYESKDRGIQMTKKIEIYVACHKPSELPENDIFVPIHVGAKISKITMPGLQRDDEGDNISDKNPLYCELTAQYWAWKHSTADYVGLCHYRRYLNFTDRTFTNYTPDYRKQVLIPVLTKETEEKYGLLDKAQIEKVVTSNDILLANGQEIYKVNTPYGPQPTALKHWEAHDMALINVKDLQKLFDIVQKDYPEIYKSMMEYMNGRYFHGFNTFVFRKDLFDEMCSFEFDVLAKLEKVVDISHYNQQLSRIYGFMGEILFSSFVYHVKKTRSDLKIRECQMLYFDKTDPVTHLQPEEKASVRIAFDITGVPEFLLYPGLATFLKQMKPETCYEIIILHNSIDSTVKKIFQSMAAYFENVTLKFQSVDFFLAMLDEKYGKVLLYTSDILPWLLPGYDRLLFLKWNVLIEGILDELYEMPLEGKLIAGAKDIYLQGKLNTFYKDDKNYASSIGIRDIFNVINKDVLLMDLAAIRGKYSLDSMMKKILEIQKPGGRMANESELLNGLYREESTCLDQKWDCLVPTNGDMRFFFNEAPLDLNKANKEAAQSAVIRSYEENAPWFIDGDMEFYLEYWKNISGSPLEEIFRNHLIVRNAGNKMDARQITWTYIDTIFPKGSHRREVMKKIFPKKGIVFKTLKKLTNI